MQYICFVIWSKLSDLFLTHNIDDNLYSSTKNSSEGAEHDASGQNDVGR